MNAELQSRLENLPADEPRSRLEPYRILILRWRRQGRSYRRIQQILEAECNVSITAMAIHKFVKQRARPRTIDLNEASTSSAIESQIAHAKPASSDIPDSRQVEPNASDRPTTTIQRSAEYLAKLAHMQALKAMPVATVTVHKRYVYNPDEPLILEKSEKVNE